MRIYSNRYFYNSRVDWGDGAQTTFQGLTFTGATFMAATHTYSTSGQFNITFTWLSYDMAMNCSITNYIRTVTVTVEQSIIF
jgi:hypothetical protein